MNYKHSCVVDADGAYKTFVLVLLEEGEGGETVENVQNYELKDGERLIDAKPPTMRPYAGAAGYIYPRWDDDTGGWIECATEDEIADWEAEHLAPEEPEDPTPPGGDLEQRVTTLEATSATKADVQAVWDEMAAAYTEGVNSI